MYLESYFGCSQNVCHPERDQALKISKLTMFQKQFLHLIYDCYVIG